MVRCPLGIIILVKGRELTENLLETVNILQEKKNEYMGIYHFKGFSESPSWGKDRRREGKEERGREEGGREKEGRRREGEREGKKGGRERGKEGKKERKREETKPMWDPPPQRCLSFPALDWDCKWHQQLCFTARAWPD